MDCDLRSFLNLARPPGERRYSVLAEAIAGQPTKMHDGMALHSWIDNVQRQRSTHTARSYLKEAWRYRMWLEYRYGREARLFHKVRADDINAYLDFLDNPAPFPLPLLASYNRTTQPFNGPLSPSSKAQAVTILGAMYESFARTRTWTTSRSAVSIRLMRSEALLRAAGSKQWRACR